MGGFGHQYGVRHNKEFFIPIILNVKYSLFYFSIPKLCGSAALTFVIIFISSKTDFSFFATSLPRKLVFIILIL